MTRKHTPGPWRVEFVPKEVRPPVCIQIRAIPKNDLGIGRLVGEADREEDMHLLAAAPEMLDALKRVLEHVEPCGCTEEDEWEEGQCEHGEERERLSAGVDSALRQIRAAVAKAEGARDE